MRDKASVEERSGFEKNLEMNNEPKRVLMKGKDSLEDFG
jgi:hypothetical protein